MRKAAESAAKWLADKVKGNPKLKPIPYLFLKSIVNKQVEWARTQRGIALDFGGCQDGIAQVRDSHDVRERTQGSITL